MRQRRIIDTHETQTEQPQMLSSEKRLSGVIRDDQYQAYKGVNKG